MRQSFEVYTCKLSMLPSLHGGSLETTTTVPSTEINVVSVTAVISDNAYI